LGKRIGFFSYGSGLASSLFSARVVGSMEGIANVLRINERLEERMKVAPAEFDAVGFIRKSSMTLDAFG
jgi:hydroxymethylglutaryl-CoA synthase